MIRCILDYAQRHLVDFWKKRPANFNFIWLEWNSYNSSIEIHIVWSRLSIFKLKSSPAQGCAIWSYKKRWIFQLKNGNSHSLYIFFGNSFTVKEFFFSRVGVASNNVKFLFLYNTFTYQQDAIMNQCGCTNWNKLPNRISLKSWFNN